MTTKKEQSHLEAIKTWIETRSQFKKDKWGNYQATLNNGKTYRFKIQATSIRFEVKVTFEATKYSPSKTEWMRVDSAYFKDIAITEDNKLKFDSRLFKPTEA